MREGLPESPWASIREQVVLGGEEFLQGLGRRLCGLKLTELAKEAEIRNYGVVATNSRRYQLRLAGDRAEKRRLAEVLRLLNCEM